MARPRKSDPPLLPSLQDPGLSDDEFDDDLVRLTQEIESRSSRGKLNTLVSHTIILSLNVMINSKTIGYNHILNIKILFY